MLGRWLAALALALSLAAPPAVARPGQAVVITRPEPYPTTGAVDALVTVELYFVPGAETSHATYRLVRGLAARHPQRVRAVFRPRQLGARAAYAPVVLAAQRAGLGLALLDRITATSPTPNLAATIAAAIALGLPRAAADNAHRDPDIAALLTATEAAAFRAPANDAVEVVVNGIPLWRAPYHLVIRATSDEQLEAVYQIALARARIAAAAGLTGAALREHERRTTFCDDDDDSPELDLGAEDAMPTVADYAWRLSALLDRGTQCVEPRLPEGRPDEPRERDDLMGPPPPLTTAALPVAGAPSIGPAAGLPIVVVCDVLGRGCRQQLSTLRQLVKLYPGEVRLVWLPWVNATILETRYGQESIARAGVALCAAELGDGWPFADDPGAMSRAPPEPLELLAEAGTDPGAISGCVATAPLRVRGLIAAAAAAGVEAGPTVIIAGRRYANGFVDGRAAAVAVEHALAPGLFDALAR